MYSELEAYYGTFGQVRSDFGILGVGAGGAGVRGDDIDRFRASGHVHR